MLSDYAPGACAYGLRGQYVVVLLYGEYLAPDKAGHTYPIQKAEYQEQRYHVCPQLVEKGTCGEVYQLVEYHRQQYYH